MNTQKRIRVEQDETPMHPRKDMDNLGTMVCWHGRYELGDEQPSESPFEFRSELPKDIIELPLYLYDHGGITMNTAGFSCPWDSGQVGFIYVSRADVREQYGWKRITKAREQQILGYLKAEVETYDQYLRGDVYGFIVEERPTAVFDAEGKPVEVDGDELWEETHSCWGFYGDDPFKNGISDHIEKELHPLLKEAA